MARKENYELNAIKQKYGVDRLWSWSRYHCYKTDKYEYFLKYVLHKKEDRTNGIYAVSGSHAHDIVEKLYNKEIQYDEMIGLYEDCLLTMNLAELKYDRSDADKNEKIANKYENCLRHFFKTHKMIEYPNKIEHFITINVEGVIFIGYIDFLHIEKYVDKEGNSRKKVVITDWKTSSEYKGDKILKEGGQLTIYAEGIRQALNIPLEDISVRWDFMKYVTIQYEQANGKIKNRHIERNAIGEKLSSSAKMWLKRNGYTESQIEDYISRMVLENDISCLPKDVKNKFVISDCYVEIPLTEETIDELKSDILQITREIRKKEEEYKSSEDDSIFWQDVTDEDSFRLNVLSGYSRKLHKPYDEYLNAQEVFRNNESDENEDEEDLLDFLNSL